MIEPSVLRAMLTAGATAEMIVSVIEADYQADQDKKAVKRAQDAKRKRDERATSAMSNGHAGQTARPLDASDTTPEVPPKKKSNPPENNPPDTLRVSTPKRGTRLSEGYQPSENLLSKAKAETKFTDEILRFETGAFRDHFLALSGPRGVKLDWDRTWMNWMREAMRRRERFKPAVVPYQPSSGPKRTWAEQKAEFDAKHRGGWTR